MLKLRNVMLVVSILFACLFCTACKTKQTKVEKLKDVDFTVVKEADIPEELKKIIDEKKKEPFKLTFSTNDKDYLYIAVGYGKQPSGGYSVTVDEVYLTKNALYVDTNLVGPSRGDLVSQAITYPYVVIKIEFMNEEVNFV